MKNSTWQVKRNGHIDPYAGNAADSETTARKIYADLAKRRAAVTLLKDGKIVQTTIKVKAS